jgi:hypothetical protein
MMRKIEVRIDTRLMQCREEILAGLLANKGGDAQVSTAVRVLAEIIASDVSRLVTFNQG